MSFSPSDIRGCKLLVATTLMLGMLTTAGHAYTAEQEQLCSGDAMRLCSSEIPDVDRVTACMVRQRASLSDGCRSVFQAAPAATEYRASTIKASKPMSLTPVKYKKPNA